jgi:tRNA-2-methylthio-N6-dimethylallyladenosine synthase
VFSFKYSPRPNTPALQLDQQVPEEEKGRRLIILQERQRQMQQERNRALIGQTFEIVVEGHNPRRGNYLGRLRTNRVVSFEGTDVALGSYRQVRIARAGATSLAGELIT